MTRQREGDGGERGRANRLELTGSAIDQAEMVMDAEERVKSAVFSRRRGSTPYVFPGLRLTHPASLPPTHPHSAYKAISYFCGPTDAC